MNRFFRYSGSKINYVNTLNSQIRTDKKVYCEPFIGSGALLFNLDKKFDKYVINDSCRNIIRIYRTFQGDLTYLDYYNFNKSIRDKFGQFKSSKEVHKDEAKENYYTFRNYFNQNVWKSDTKEEGLYLHILANTCINSFLRFGPNGMNQSFGNRHYELDERTFFEFVVSINNSTR